MRTQYTLKVYPTGLGRSVYRTITICGTDTLDQLCMAISSTWRKAALNPSCLHTYII